MGTLTILDTITRRLEHSLTKTQAQDVLAAILMCMEYGLTATSVAKAYEEEDDDKG